MAGNPIYNDCCSPTSITTSATCTCSNPFTLTTNSTSEVTRVNYVYSNWASSVRKVVKKPKRTKEQKQKERAERLHRMSFLMVQEVKPKVFKVIGHPFRKAPEPYHKNYALH